MRMPLARLRGSLLNIPSERQSHAHSNMHLFRMFFTCAVHRPHRVLYPYFILTTCPTKHHHNSIRRTNQDKIPYVVIAS